MQGSPVLNKSITTIGHLQVPSAMTGEPSSFGAAVKNGISKSLIRESSTARLS